MGSGDTLIVKAGTYVETIPRNAIPAGGGSFATATKVQAAPGETVWLRPSSLIAECLCLVIFGGSQTYIEMTGINLDGALVDAGFVTIEDGYVSGAGTGRSHHIRWQDSEFKGAPIGSGHVSSHGILTRGYDGSTIGSNEFIRLVIHDIGPDGYIHGMYLTTPNDLVDSCEFYNITGAGVQVQSGPLNPQETIRNSKFHDPRNFQFDSGTGSHNGTHWGIVISYSNGGANGSTAQIYNNLFYNITTTDGESTFGIHMFSADATSNIDNNSCYNVGTKCYEIATGTNNFRNNIAYLAGTNYTDSTGGTKSNNTTDGTNPNFVSTTSGDPNVLKLSATSATAIDTGVCLGTVATDKDGVARPQGPGCDRGASEYLPAGALPGAPTSFIPADVAIGVDLFPTLSFTSSNATAYDFYFSSFSGQSTATFTDLFDRANSTDLGASWTPFTVGYTNAQILGNRVRSTSTSLDSVEQVVGSFAADQWVRIRLSTFGTGIVGAHVILRGQGGGGQVSGYIVGAVKGVSTYRTWIYRFSAGVETLIASEDTTPWAAGDLLEAHIVGNTITVYRNGNTDLRLSANDPAATYSSGGVGIHIFADSIGQVEIDNFEAGDIGPVFVGTFSTALYAPINLIPNTVYYWKAAGRNAQGVTLSSVLSFTTLGTTATPIGVRLRCIHGTANCP
jgi:hypothetical protein